MREESWLYHKRDHMGLRLAFAMDFEALYISLCICIQTFHDIHVCYRYFLDTPFVSI